MKFPRRSPEPPGRLLDLGGRALHVHATGSGGPVVAMEAGIAASSVSWSLVQDRVAAMTTAVSYDRAGFGWSDAGRVRTALDAARDLARMLELGGFPPPYVLVGHSYGGLIVRLFQQQFPEKVAGLVLVDPVIRGEWRDMSGPKRAILGRGVTLSRRGAWLARMGVVRAALWLLMNGSRRIPKMLARASAGNGASVTDRLAGEVRKMPKEHWPAIAWHWGKSRSFTAMADNLENLPVSVDQLDETRDLGDLPLTVLTARKPNPEHTAETALSSRGVNIVVAGSGHWIQLDAPDVVVEAIGSMLKQLR